MPWQWLGVKVGFLVGNEDVSQMGIGLAGLGMLMFGRKD